jgi:NodT family efflux transporter outer membrane factor (OMF) lipoprotein
MRYVPLIAVLVCLTLVACAPRGPNYQKPVVDVTDTWQDIDDPRLATSAEADVHEWWKVFDDPVLDSLIETARANNLTLQAAGLRVLEARARLGIATGLKWPQLQTVSGGGVAVSGTDTDANIAVLDRDFNTVQASFNLAWELDFWGRFRRGTEAARAGMEASIATYDDVMVTLTAEVARTYILIRTFEERLALAIANAVVQQRALDIAETRFDNGLVTELDVQQARVILNDTRARIQLLETGLQASKNALAVLLGSTPDLGDMLEGPVGIPGAPVDITVGMPAELLRRRPDVRRAERLLAAQSARIGIAVTDLYPRFSLIGSIGFRSSDAKIDAGIVSFENELGDVLDSDSLTTFIGPFVSWNIFNYGRIKNNIRVQDARFEALLASYRNTVLISLAEAESAITGYLNSHDQAVALERSVEAATRSVELALLQYREGLVNFNTVLATLTAQLAQQDLLSLTRGLTGTNMVALYKAVGGGWNPAAKRTLTDYVPVAIQERMRERTKAWRKILPGEGAVEASSDGEE